jgi:hypothetical protein
LAHKTVLTRGYTRQTSEGEYVYNTLKVWGTNEADKKPKIDLMISRCFEERMCALTATTACACISLADFGADWFTCLREEGVAICSARVWSEAIPRYTRLSFKKRSIADLSQNLEVHQVGECYYGGCHGDPHKEEHYVPYLQKDAADWLREEGFDNELNHNGENAYWYATIGQKYIDTNEYFDACTQFDKRFQAFCRVMGGNWECAPSIMCLWRSVIDAGAAPYRVLAGPLDWEDSYVGALKKEHAWIKGTLYDNCIKPAIERGEMPGIYRDAQGNIVKIKTGSFCAEETGTCTYPYDDEIFCFTDRIIGDAFGYRPDGSSSEHSFYYDNVKYKIVRIGGIKPIVRKFTRSFSEVAFAGDGSGNGAVDLIGDRAILFSVKITPGMLELDREYVTASITLNGGWTLEYDPRNGREFSKYFEIKNGEGGVITIYFNVRSFYNNVGSRFLTSRFKLKRSTAGYYGTPSMEISDSFTSWEPFTPAPAVTDGPEVIHYTINQNPPTYV